jgi:hypothetical protein
MSDTRRFFFKKVFASASGLVAATRLPSNLCAGCASVTNDFDLLPQVGQSIPGRKVGDCEIKGMTLTILPGAISIFNAQVCTHFTHTKDVWHMRLRILSRLVDKPSQLYSWFDHTFDGPQMSEKDVPLFHDWSATFTIQADVFNPPALYSPAYLEINDCC